jgi:hypothetical protein
MEKAYQLHLLADFEPEVSIDPEDVTEVIDGGREFFAAVSRYIAEHHPEPREPRRVEMDEAVSSVQ